MRVSIIIPVLNEAEALKNHLPKLQSVRALGHELIVVDGGSEDTSEIIAGPKVDKFIVSEPGRAAQMNMGAAVASGDILLFLHVDTFLPEDAISTVINSIGSSKESWGRFDVKLSGDRWPFRMIETMMNWRSRVTGIATGDQAMFITRDLYQAAKGFSNIPLMEDVELSGRLKKIQHPVCLPHQVVTSSRRWEKGGVFKTVLLMWRLRFMYWLGADPAVLSRQYR